MAAPSALQRLADYRRKRDFNRTPEPQHGDETAGRQLVIQQHYATRLHFDLRLEIDGVLASWAVTRGPSANPHDKRLAVRTEDHPLSYGRFEGVIPKGEYGGGTVILWEQTTYTPLNGDPAAALAKGEIKFESHGTRLQGRWVLVRMKGEEKRENWLLIKERDAFAERDDQLARRYDTGVLSGRTRSEIETGVSARRKTNASRQQVPLPRFVAPQLCQTAGAPPEGAGWAFEMKYDGYRLELAVAGGEARAFTRSGLDWSDRFPGIVAAARALPCRSALLDGEAAVLDGTGLSDFPALVAALEKGRGSAIAYVAFDVLEIDGNDLRKQPYRTRKARLAALTAGLGAASAIRYGDYVEGHGAAMFAKVAAAGGEGIIAKRLDAPYRSERSPDWLKIKTDTRTDVIVIGTMPSAKGARFASLLAAVPRNGALVYVGRIGTGYNAGARARLDSLLSLSKTGPALANPDMLPPGARFIAKPFSAEVRFGGWTGDGQMRQARFIAVQHDRPPPSATGETAMPRQAKVQETAAEWQITHRDRVIFPDSGITKGDIADYYRKVWPRMAPHLAGRPVSLLRAPDSIAGETFFQRHPLPGMRAGIDAFGPVREQYFSLDGEQGLATAVQFGTVEFHGWNATLPDLDKPDRMIFDLDPDEDLPFATVKEAALVLRDYLAAAKLISFPLLSGGKGIHLVVPLDRSNHTDDVEAFCGGFARKIAAEKPATFVATISKAKRSGKILIDWLRNRKKATAILPWSVRARPGAPIAAPIAWKDLGAIASPRHYSIGHIAPNDRWPDFPNTRQHIAAATLSLLR